MEKSRSYPVILGCDISYLCRHDQPCYFKVHDVLFSFLMPWRFLTYHPDCRLTDHQSLNMPCVSVFMWMQPAVSFALSAHTNSEFPLSTGFLQSVQPSIVCKVDIPAALRVNPDLIPMLH